MKVLLRLLILCLVPILVVTVPTTAQAATVHGSPSPLSVNLGSSSPTNFDCNLSAYWVVTDGVGTIKVKGDCEVGWGAELDVMEIQSILFAGDGCQALTVGPDDAEQAWTMVATISSGTEPCTITTATFNMCSNDFNGGCGFQQEDWVIVPPTDPSGQCSAGTVSAPTLAPTTSDESGRQFQSLSFNIGNPAAGTTPGQWWYYTIHDSTFGQPGASAGYDGFLDTNIVRVFPQAAISSRPFVATDWSLRPVTSFSFTTNGVQVTSRADRPEVWEFPVIGVGVVHQPTASTVTGYGASNIGDGLKYLPQETLVGASMLAGVTDPGMCAFYWGARIAENNSETNDTDLPMGPINDPGGSPTDPEPAVPAPVADAGCTFKFSDPSTWLEGGMCAAVGLLSMIWDTLKSILGALGSLAAAIFGPIVDAVQAVAGAILDGLGALFIPADGFMDSRVTALKQDFRNTAPGAYLDAVTAQSFNVSASGCGGIPVNWSMSGESFSFDFLAACSGFMANAAAIVKLAASALLVIFGGFACVRAVGAGFGWAPSIGKGAAA